MFENIFLIGFGVRAEDELIKIIKTYNVDIECGSNIV